MNQKFIPLNIIILWHDYLGHSISIIMYKLIENPYGHPLKNQKILLPIKLFMLLAHKENLWLNHSFLRLVINIHDFTKNWRDM